MTLVERIGNPISFLMPSGVRAHGFEATLLADVCEGVLKAREAGVLMTQQLGIAAKCEILVPTVMPGALTQTRTSLPNRRIDSSGAR